MAATAGVMLLHRPAPGAGRRKARREVGAGGCDVGFSVDYDLRVCPLTPLNPLLTAKAVPKKAPQITPQNTYLFLCMPLQGHYGGVIVANV